MKTKANNNCFLSMKVLKIDILKSDKNIYTKT